MTAYQEPFTSDFVTPMDCKEVETPVKVNQSYLNDSTYYRTSCNCVLGFLVVVFCLFGFGSPCLLAFLAIVNGSVPIPVIFPPLIFGIIGVILDFIENLYFKIEINGTLGTISLYKVKVFFCFNKPKIIQIKDVVQVIIQIDHSANIDTEGEYVRFFEVIFRLSNGQSFKGCSGIVDKDGEAHKAYTIIRNGLPERISIDGDLAY